MGLPKWMTWPFGQEDDNEEPKLPVPPDYFEDPDYRQTQDFLKQYGFNLLEGKPNDYYGEIGSYGGPEFEKMLGLSNRDIQQSAAEAAAKSGRGRGGFLPAMTAQTVADNTSKLRYADYLKAMAGRQYLFGEGRGITEGVRSAGQTEGSRRNAFNLDQYGINRQNTMFDINRADEAAGAQGEMFSNLFKIGAGAFAGGMTGGLPGAIIGGIGGLDTMAQTGALDKIFDRFGGGGVGNTGSSGTPIVSPTGKAKLRSGMDDDTLNSLFQRVR